MSVQTVIIDIVDDSIVESLESFQVTLHDSDPGLGDTSNFMIDANLRTTQVIITDDDGKFN